MPAEEGVSKAVVVVVSGGGAPAARAVDAVPLDAPLIAADEGLEHALALGLEVTVAVGDFDSAAPEVVTAAEAAGVRIERHPAEKNATDLELALDVAAGMEPERILVLASDSGRLDHSLANVLVLGSERYADSTIDAYVGQALVHVVRGVRRIDGEPGELVSLLALYGRAEGVTTDGLAYALRGEALEAGSSRGVSNVFSAETATVTVEQGVVLAVRPGSAG
jgi:thiamine pyrophosphokinase